ncbi:MAG: ImmA/IrrE family metallo-endopeptidase [Armatimonadetes bacterium]|nr:ImmA/IrrE family metallo-endopeptidase [Armatimonadota bacterium]
MATEFDPVPACFCGVQFLPVARLERIVRDKLVRFERETGTRPALPIDIESLVEIMEKIEVEYFDDDHPEFEPDFLGAYDFSRDKMFVRESIPHEGRRRFTWAHEYGHYILHKPHFLQGVFDFYTESSKAVVQLHRGEGGTRNKLESQANMFASHILMPTAFVSQLFAGGWASIEEASRTLSAAADVSLQSARIRLENFKSI